MRQFNRLVRNMQEGGELVQLLIDGTIKEIRTPYVAYHPGDNILPMVVEAASATQYSLDLVHNVKRGMKGHFEDGGLNYRARQGYRNARHPLNSKRGIVLPDGRRFALMRKAWDLLLTGGYTPAHSVAVLNDKWGYRTRRTKKAGGRPISPATAYKLFTDPFYAGYVRYKGEVRQGAHKPMVSLAELNRVQEIIHPSQVRS